MKGDPKNRAKLGLALAGGGFRASLFHVGVLRRMAELDLLRYVEVMSTVSGGSIVSALYLLLLKERLEDPALAGLGPETLVLERNAYEAIVDELQQSLVCGVQKNLRNRLLMNPWVLLKVMLGSDTLGTAMARLYERHFFRAVVRRLREREAALAAHAALPTIRDAAPHREGCISVRAMRLRREQVQAAGGSEDYNHRALNPDLDPARGGPGSALTRVIVNATSLNSGARFWFSHAEVGDWYLGHFRYDEISTLLVPRKVLLELKPSELTQLDAKLRGATTEAQRARIWQDAALPIFHAWRYPQHDTAAPQGEVPHVQTRRLARWWRTARLNGAIEAPIDPNEPTIVWNALDGWQGFEFGRFVQRLAFAEAGRLRQAKAFAWYLLIGRHRTPRVSAGFDDATLELHFWDALEAIDATSADGLQERLQSCAGTAQQAKLKIGLWTLVIEVYNLSAAEAMSPNVKDEWDRLPLSHAVAASAAFPPVFPPFQLRDLYDDLHVRTLGLTDGGVFDNLGTTALLDEQCDYIIASDPGGIFETQQSQSSVGRVGLTGRLTQILGERPISLYRHELHERRRLGVAAAAGKVVPGDVAQFVASRALKALAIFRIDSERLEAKPKTDAYRPELARLRTDLDAFNDIECKTLINEGYILADQYLRSELRATPFDPASRPLDLFAWAPLEAVPLTVHAPPARVQEVLSAGRARFLRALRLKAPLSVSVTLLASAALVAAVWRFHWDWAALHAALTQLGATLFPKLGEGLLSMIPPLILIPVLQWISLRWIAVIGLAGVFYWIFLREPLSRRLARSKLVQRPRRGTWRKLATIAKAARHSTGWLVLLVVPAVAVAVAIGAALTQVLFASPLLRKTRDPDGFEGHDYKRVRSVA